MRTSFLGGVTNKNRLGSGRSHSAVMARRVAGETQECTFPKAIVPPRFSRPITGAYVNTLDLVDPDAAVAAMILRAIATVIVVATWIVSLLGLP